MRTENYEARIENREAETPRLQAHHSPCVLRFAGTPQVQSQNQERRALGASGVKLKWCAREESNLPT
jgi:hypothetical protein